VLPRAGRYRSVKISEPLERVSFVCFLVPSEDGAVEVIYVEKSVRFKITTSYTQIAYLGVVLDFHSQAIQITLRLFRERRAQSRQQLFRTRDERDLSLRVLRTGLEPPRRAIEILCDFACSFHACGSTTCNHNRLRGFHLRVCIGQSNFDFLVAVAVARPDGRGQF